MCVIIEKEKMPASIKPGLRKSNGAASHFEFRGLYVIMRAWAWLFGVSVAMQKSRGDGCGMFMK